MTCPAFDEILQHLEQDLSVSRSKEIEDHLVLCSFCRKAVSDIRSVTSRIATEPGEFRSPEFVKRVVSKASASLNDTPIARAWPRWVWPVLAMPLAAAAVSLIVLPLRSSVPHDSDSSFSARGAASFDPNRWISLRVFHPGVTPGAYAEVEGTILRDDPLVFSVRNAAQSSYRFMMIFGIQDTGSVYWYYPAYNDAQQNPKSVPIEASAETKSLGEEIRHKLSPGWLRVVGLFSDRPLDVATIERLVERGLSERGSVVSFELLPIEDTGQLSKLVRVIPGEEP